MSSGDEMILALANTTNHRLVFRAGLLLVDDTISFQRICSNNCYRLKPVFEVVEAEENAVMKVTRLFGTPGRNRLLIQFKKAHPSETNARALFKGWLLLTFF